MRLFVVLAFLAGAVVGGLLGGAASADEWASCVQLQRRVDSLGRELDIAQWYLNRQRQDLATVAQACRRRR